MLVKLLIFSLVVLLADGCSSKSGGNKDAAPANAPQAASASPSNPDAKPAAKPESAANPATTDAAAANVGLDACGLIEKSEIEAVQGAKVQGMVPGKRDADALAVSQCHYTVFSSDGSKNLSVHLEVTQAGPKSSSSNAVRDYWEKSFRPEKGRREGEKKRKKEGKPLPVPGIGDEAYWMGSEKVGAVYVLTKNRMVRVSVGGPDDAKTKIEKSKTLVAKVLKRLP